MRGDTVVTGSEEYADWSQQLLGWQEVQITRSLPPEQRAGSVAAALLPANAH